MRSDVVQAIGDLIKSGNADTTVPSYTLPSFKTENIYPIFQKYFTQEAQEVLAVKTTQLIHQRQRIVMTPELGSLLEKLGLKSCENGGLGLIVHEYNKVEYCAVRASRDNAHKAATRVINTINHLASKKYITASLCELILLFITVPDRPEPDCMVLSYVAVTPTGSQYIKANMTQMFVDEGTIPIRIED